MLGIFLCQTTMSTMQTKTAIDGEVMLLRTAHQLDTSRTRPTVTCGIAHRRSREDIDTTSVLVVLMTKEVVLIRNDTHHGQ